MTGWRQRSLIGGLSFDSRCYPYLRVPPAVAMRDARYHMSYIFLGDLAAVWPWILQQTFLVGVPLKMAASPARLFLELHTFNFHPTIRRFTHVIDG